MSRGSDRPSEENEERGSRWAHGRVKKKDGLLTSSIQPKTGSWDKGGPQSRVQLVGLKSSRLLVGESRLTKKIKGGGSRISP